MNKRSLDIWGDDDPLDEESSDAEPGMEPGELEEKDLGEDADEDE